MILDHPAQKLPSWYSLPAADSMSVNGSSATVHCSNVTDVNNILTCVSPTSSVLFDGNIPTLTGLNGNMWASQLLTMRSYSDMTISSNFSGTPDFVGVRRVEIVLFNCEQWGISVRTIGLQASGSFIGYINPSITSCDSLVRVCIPNLHTNSEQTELTLSFITIDPSDWVHIAEILFYGAGPNCPQDTIIKSTTTPIHPPTNPSLPPPPRTTTATTTTTSATSMLLLFPTDKTSEIHSVYFRCLVSGE